MTSLTMKLRGAHTMKHEEEARRPARPLERLVSGSWFLRSENE